MTTSVEKNGKATDRLPGLRDGHLAELRASGLSDDTIRAAGIHSETDYGRLSAFLKRQRYSAKMGAAICYPFYDSTGAITLRRVKPDNPPKSNGKVSKYLQPSGVPCMPYIVPAVRQAIEADPQATVFFTEGEKKSLCVTQHAAPCVGLTGIDCFHRKNSAALLPELQSLSWKSRKVYIVYDAPANEDVRRAESQLAASLKREGATVKIVRLPPGPNGEKVGVDDFIVAHGAGEFWRLVDSAEDPAPLDADEMRMTADSADPAIEAKAFLKTGEQDGLSRLRYHRGGFLLYTKGAYIDVVDSEVKAQLVRHLDRHLRRLGSSKTSDILMHVKAHSLLSGRVESPSWLLDAPNGWKATDVIATPQFIVHLPSVADGRPGTTKATPNLFTTTALDYEYGEHAPPPKQWHEFLRQLWNDDQQSIDCLQEIFGYLLTTDTRQHKIFMLLGPKRSGKGTIARIIRGVVGLNNCCGPTLAGLAERFGLWPLLGKSVAIISDARLSGRTDSAVVVERLLSISGEDAQTIDRKMLEPVTCKLPTRFVILSNEEPRLADASGALVGRLVLLRLTESFYGREDHSLTDKLLAELPGILIWSIAGWRRLNDRGFFVQPASADNVLQEMGELSSPISAFLRDRCEIGPDFEVKRQHLYENYKSWCEAQGIKRPDDDSVFGRNLRAAVPSISSAQPRENGERVRYYRGIGLR